MDAGGEVGGCVIIDSCLWSRLARDLSSSTRLGRGGLGGLGVIWESFVIIWGSFGNHLNVKLVSIWSSNPPV